MDVRYESPTSIRRLLQGRMTIKTTNVQHVPPFHSRKGAPYAVDDRSTTYIIQGRPLSTMR
jgi:hypothetical protein